MNLLEASRQVIARMGHLKKYQPELVALRNAIQAVEQRQAAVATPPVDQPEYTQLNPSRPSESFLERVERLEREELEKQNAAQAPKQESE